MSTHRASTSTEGYDKSAHATTMHSTSSMHQAPSAGFNMSPELFEKLYLQPKMPQYSRFANPTPMGLVGFVISTFTFSMILMGWGGASGLPAVVGIFVSIITRKNRPLPARI
jgi:hypothetical protein